MIKCFHNDDNDNDEEVKKVKSMLKESAYAAAAADRFNSFDSHVRACAADSDHQTLSNTLVNELIRTLFHE